MERLEESLGRLLLEKETWQQAASEVKHRDNCCVTFTDAGNDVERVVAASGSNCCVRFKSKGYDSKEKGERSKLFLALAVVFMLCATVVGIAAVKAGESG